MAQHDRDIQRIDEIFRIARRERADTNSVRPEVERRIAEISIMPARSMLSVSIATSLAVCVFGVFLWCQFSGRSQPPRPRDYESSPNVAEGISLETGDVAIAEQVAAVVDDGAVVVIWSYRGRGLATVPAAATACDAGRYRLFTLREHTTADGRTVVCSLFIPRAGVRPILQPPSIFATSQESGTISCSVWPRTGSTPELADAIRSAGFDDKSDFGVDDIMREIRKQSPQ